MKRVSDCVRRWLISIDTMKYNIYLAPDSLNIITAPLGLLNHRIDLRNSNNGIINSAPHTRVGPSHRLIDCEPTFYLLYSAIFTNEKNKNYLSIDVWVRINTICKISLQNV